MSAFKSQQLQFTINGRPFHFVSYEGRPESLARNQPAEPAMWCLMVEGRRVPVTPFLPAQSLEDAQHFLSGWVRKNALPAKHA
jgi:hypothetical protein